MTTGRINQVCGLPIDSMRGTAALEELRQMNKQFAQKTTLGCIGNRQVCDQRELENIEISFSDMPGAPERRKRVKDRANTKKGNLEPRKHPGGRLGCALTKTETCNLFSCTSEVKPELWCQSRLHEAESQRFTQGTISIL